MSQAEELVPERPVIDADRIKQVHDSIRTMPEILLDPDPLSSGPQAMNNKRALIRNYIGRCTDIELQILEDLGVFHRELARDQAKYKIQFQSLMASNPHVRAGRSADDRRAAADVILAELVAGISESELAVDDLERLLVVVRTKKTDLKNLQAQLKEQMKTCEHELSLGGKWGQSKAPLYGDLKPVASSNVDHIDDLMGEVDAKHPEVSVTVTEDELHELNEDPDANPADLLPSDTSSTEVSDFFDNLELTDESESEPQLETQATEPSEEDLDALLDSLDD
jgi:hypothetical protein